MRKKIALVVLALLVGATLLFVPSTGWARGGHHYRHHGHSSYPRHRAYRHHYRHHYRHDYRHHYRPYRRHYRRHYRHDHYRHHDYSYPSYRTYRYWY